MKHLSYHGCGPNADRSSFSALELELGRESRVERYLIQV